MQAARAAIFLDRDGVIVENRADYLTRAEDITFLPGALTALSRVVRQLPEAAIILVTNQSAVGRGIISFDAAMGIHRKIVEQISASGGRIDATFVCPHGPADGCDCRKPAPGMLLRAAREFGLDLNRSYLVGDAVTDLDAALAAGAQGILVRTGRGVEQQQILAGSPHLARCPVVDDLSAAVDHICLHWSADVMAGVARVPERWAG